jgi:mannose-6-phosphate isomerase-like protein (cupin superfamily)
MAKDDRRVDRREFLQVSAAAGLAAVASGAVDKAQAQSSPDPTIFDQSAGMPLRIRRVVTGHDEDGRAMVAIDEIAENVLSRRAGHQGTVVWSTGESPADNMDPEDGASRTLATSDDNGTVFRIVKYDPGVADYAVVMSGEITMGLDVGEVHLRQGDVLVQRGTIHNWVKSGSAPCVVAFILCVAKPIETSNDTLGATG